MSRRWPRVAHRDGDRHRSLECHRLSLAGAHGRQQRKRQRVELVRRERRVDSRLHGRHDCADDHRHPHGDGHERLEHELAGHGQRDDERRDERRRRRADLTVDASPATVSGPARTPFGVRPGDAPGELFGLGQRRQLNSANDSVKIDTVNPTISVTHTPNGSNGWNTSSPVTVTVTTSDGGSGLAGAPACTVDGSPATVTGTGPYSVSVTGDGTHPVSCSVSDLAGNSNAGNDSVKIDTVNPTITVSHTSTGTNGWNTNSPVTVNVTVSDATSGIAGTPTCTVDSSPATVSGSGPYTVSVSGQGSHSVSCSVSDNAGRSNTGGARSRSTRSTRPARSRSTATRRTRSRRA